MIHRWYPFSQHLNSLKKCCEKGAVLRKGGNCPEKWEIFPKIASALSLWVEMPKN